MISNFFIKEHFERSILLVGNSFSLKKTPLVSHWYLNTFHGLLHCTGRFVELSFFSAAGLQSAGGAKGCVFFSCFFSSVGKDEATNKYVYICTYIYMCVYVY